MIICLFIYLGDKGGGREMLFWYRLASGCREGADNELCFGG